jgi:hypothetical protein
MPEDPALKSRQQELSASQRERLTPGEVALADQPAGGAVLTCTIPLPAAPPEPGEDRRLRELAAWYRQFAELAGNATIWEARLRTAEDLEAEAERIKACRLQRSAS